MRYANRPAYRLIAAIAAVIMLLASVIPTASAIDAEHEILNTPTEERPPFSISPNDDITFKITADFNYDMNKPDEIDIRLDTSFLFVKTNEAVVYDVNGNQLEWAGVERTSKENDLVKLYLAPMPETAASICLTYTCTVDEIVSIGPAGMSNKANIITHTNGVQRDENISSSIEVESRSAYSWFMELWTIDSSKKRQVITTSTGSTNYGTGSGPDMHPGQSVEGASFKIYTDENLINNLSFAESFRRYVVCSDANAKHVDEIHLDNAGRADIIGLRAGTYWVQETKPANEYNKAVSEPIKVEFTYDEDELPSVKLINVYDQHTTESNNIETRNGPAIIIDYKDYKTANPHAKQLIATAIILAAIAITGSIILIIDMRNKIRRTQ